MPTITAPTLANSVSVRPAAVACDWKRKKPATVTVKTLNNPTPNAANMLLADLSRKLHPNSIKGMAISIAMLETFSQTLKAVSPTIPMLPTKRPMIYKMTIGLILWMTGHRSAILTIRNGMPKR